MSVSHFFKVSQQLKRFIVLAACGMLLVFVFGLWLAGSAPVAQAAAPAQSSTPTPQPETGGHGGSSMEFASSIDCLVCHGNPDLKGVTKDGEVVSLAIDQAMMDASMHGRLGCGACHKDMNGYPHNDGVSAACSLCHSDLSGNQVDAAQLPFDNVRAQTTKLNEACFGCHEDIYQTFLTGMHARNLKSGNPEAPLCVDCHGSHNVQAVSPDSFAKACGECHQAIYSSYATSLHAVAAGQEGDAPTCAECHGVHSVDGPRDPDFRRASVVMCLECHEDQALMAKYEVPAVSFDPNVDNYHALPVSMFERTDVDIAGRAPVCYDCHGMHNIRPSEDAASAANAANLTRTCRQCHPDTGRDLTGIGPAHNKAESSTASVVNGITWFYRLTIPLSVVAMLGLVVLDAGKRLGERKARKSDSDEEHKA